MNIKDFLFRIFPQILKYKLAYRKYVKIPGPMTLTFSVTNYCQSRCKTCSIWKIYPDKHQNPKEELSLAEIQKIFRSIGRVYFFNISGGEPFLRNDLPAIVDASLTWLKPRIIHLPTNAIASNRIISLTQEILEMVRNRGLQTTVTVKPSIDGIGARHDEVRGVPGNWEKLLDTIAGLKELEKVYQNFHLELGTVISNFNKQHIKEINDFVNTLGIQSYRNEIAEQREEFLNMGEPITPSGEEYRMLMHDFTTNTRREMGRKRPLARVTESLRLVYYDLATKIVRENRQIIPCFAGISNVHLTPSGDVWPCCVLGYAKPMGNLREAGYDFWKVWQSEQADLVRQSIKNKECACPLANQAYSNIICHTPSLMKVMVNILKA